MAFCKNAEDNCCFGHAHGSTVHSKPQYKGKPFEAQEHREELERLGFTSVRDELKAEAKANKKPPGQPKKVGVALVYPARHFA